MNPNELPMTSAGVEQEAEPEVQSRGEPSRLGSMRRTRQAESALTGIAFLALFCAYALWLGTRFVNVDARVLDVHTNVPILLLGLAVLVTLVAGLFDLSVAGMCTLTTFLTVGLTTNQHLPFGLIIAICMVIGVVGGVINGLLVEKLQVNAFIATLGTGGIFTGISAVYSKGTQVVPLAGGTQLPGWFSELGAYGTKAPSWILWVATAILVVAAVAALDRARPAKRSPRVWRIWEAGVVVVVGVVLVVGLSFSEWIADASWLVTILVAVSVLLWVVIDHTTFGRHLRAIGSNREAARLAGVPVRVEVVKAFALGGALAALAGILLAANQGSASPDIASSFLLPAFAAAFLSTVVFSAGRFTVFGTVLGGMFVAWTSQGLIVGGVPPTWAEIVNGVVLVSAVALSSVIRRRN